MLFSSAVIVACGASESDSNTNSNGGLSAADFTDLAALSTAPVFTSNAINAGDTAVIDMTVMNTPDQIEIHIVKTTALDSYSAIGLGWVNDSNTNNIEIFTNCGADSGTYYPHIVLTQSAPNQIPSTTTYFFSSDLSTTHYSVTYVSPTGTYTGTSDLPLSLLSVDQPGGSDSQADLSVAINSVSASGGKVTINYDIMNLGSRGASAYSIEFWANSAITPAIGSDPGEAYRFFAIDKCIAPGQSLAQQSITFSTNATGGTAYVMVDKSQDIAESDETNNLSSLVW